MPGLYKRHCLPVYRTSILLVLDRNDKIARPVQHSWSHVSVDSEAEGEAYKLGSAHRPR